VGGGVASAADPGRPQGAFGAGRAAGGALEIVEAEPGLGGFPVRRRPFGVEPVEAAGDRVVGGGAQVRGERVQGVVVLFA
jgi:hypothetical protein